MILNQLTFTRFLAAVSIVVFHSQSNMWPFNTALLNDIFNNANTGVSYFFILSGFVMIIAYGKHKSVKIKKRSYYLNRLARIYPVYLLALVLVAVISITRHTLFIKPFLLQLFVIQAWFPGSILTLNYPGWSLSVEALFYLAFPFLFNYFYRKFSLKSISVLVISLWLVTQVVLHYFYLSPFYKGNPSHSYDLLFYFPLLHINEFMIGNLVGFIYLKLINKQKDFDLLIIVLFVAMFIMLSFDTVVNFHDGLLAVFFVPLILLMSLNNGKITKIFSNKYLIILGEASYGMYILQYPIMLIVHYGFGKMNIIDENIRFYVYLLILTGVSVGCYYLIEIPAKDWIRNLRNNKIKKAKLETVNDTVNF